MLETDLMLMKQFFSEKNFIGDLRETCEQDSYERRYYLSIKTFSPAHNKDNFYLEIILKQKLNIGNNFLKRWLLSLVLINFFFKMKSKNLSELLTMYGPLLKYFEQIKDKVNEDVR